MSDEDLRDAVDHLIKLAGKHGTITARMYEKACGEYLVRPEILASRFLSKTGINWQDYKMSAPGPQDKSLVLARQIARDKVTESNDWWEHLSKHSGSVFSVKRQKFIYIGAKIDGDGNPVHHILRVRNLQTNTASWWEVNTDFPALSEMLTQG